MHFLVLSAGGKSFVYVINYCVGAGISTFMSLSNGLDPHLFLSTDGKDAVHEGRNGRKGVIFAPELALSLCK